MRREGSKHARNADNNIYSGTEFRREEGGEERGGEGLGKEGTEYVEGRDSSDGGSQEYLSSVALINWSVN